METLDRKLLIIQNLINKKLKNRDISLHIDFSYKYYGLFIYYNKKEIYDYYKTFYSKLELYTFLKFIAKLEGVNVNKLYSLLNSKIG